MRRVYLSLLLLLAAGPLAAVDYTAPGFSLPDILSTNTISLSRYQGKVILLNFWATWCPPCRAEIPDLIRLQQTYSNDLIIIGVALDRDGAVLVREFSLEYGINYPVVMGTSKLVQDYGGIRAIPTTFLIDQDGDIGKKIVGGRDFAGFQSVVLPYLED